MISLNIGMIFLGILATAKNPIYSVGDTIEISGGYSDFSGMGGGSNTDVVSVDSIRMSADTTFYTLKIISNRAFGSFEDRYKMMAYLFSGDPLRLATLESTPSNVQTNTPALKRCRWIVPEYSSLIFYPSIHPIAKYCPIPILDSSLLNMAGIQYKVRVTDSSGMLWENSDRAYEFTGKRLRYLSQNDTVGIQVSDSSPSHLIVTPKWGYPYSIKEITPLVFAFINVSTKNAPLIDTAMPMGSGYYSTQLRKYIPFKRSPSHIARLNNKIYHGSHQRYICINGARSIMNNSHSMIPFENGVLNNFTITNGNFSDQK